METRQESRHVRLKAVDKRRGHVLQRYTYKGITFNAGKGWSKVPKELADHLAGVRQIDGDPHSPVAFDVASDTEARVIDESEARDAQQVRRAADDLPLQVGRGAIGTADLPDAASGLAPVAGELGARRGGGARKEKE